MKVASRSVDVTSGKNCATFARLSIHNREVILGRTTMTNDKLRHARMKIQSAVWISHGSQAWSSVLDDISATGAKVKRPEGWDARVGERVNLDMLLGGDLNIHVQAVVARIADDCIGFAYDRIPADKEVPLWDLLGGYADTLEHWDDP